MVSAPTKPLKSQIAVAPELPALPVLQFPKDCPLTDELLLEISALNDAWRFERTSEGALLMNFPAGGQSGEIESEIGAQLRIWWRSHRQGAAYSPSTGIRHFDGRVMAPDAAWISAERLGKRTHAEHLGLIDAVPDFVVEVRSPSDTLAQQQQKMEDWIAYGVRLGVLVDPKDRLVFVYRPSRPTERLERPTELSAEPELPGFMIDFEEVWALIRED